MNLMFTHLEVKVRIERVLDLHVKFQVHFFGWDQELKVLNKFFK